MNADRIIEKADEYLRTGGNASHLGGYTAKGLYNAVLIVSDEADVSSNNPDFLSAVGAIYYAHWQLRSEYPAVEAREVLAGRL